MSRASWKFASLRVAPARLAPVRSRRLKLAPERSQPGHSLTRPAIKSSRWSACARTAGYAATTASKATAGRRGYGISFIVDQDSAVSLQGREELQSRATAL